MADGETAVFDAQAAVDRAAIARRASRAPTDDARPTPARRWRARRTSWPSARRAPRAVDAPLPTPNEAQVVSARGDLAFARVNLEKLTIRAPIDGTVLQININPGELAAPSALQPLMLIADLSTLNVRAELDERDVAEIKVGQPHRSAPRRFPARSSPAR